MRKMSRKNVTIFLGKNVTEIFITKKITEKVTTFIRKNVTEKVTVFIMKRL